MTGPIEEQIPADWYPDPTNRKRFRYWDGAGWTQHTLDAAAIPDTGLVTKVAKKDVAKEEGEVDIRHPYLQALATVFLVVAGVLSLLLYRQDTTQYLFCVAFSILCISGAVFSVLWTRFAAALLLPAIFFGSFIVALETLYINPGMEPWKAVLQCVLFVMVPFIALLLVASTFRPRWRNHSISYGGTLVLVFSVLWSLLMATSWAKFSYLDTKTGRQAAITCCGVLNHQFSSPRFEVVRMVLLFVVPLVALLSSLWFRESQRAWGWIGTAIFAAGAQVLLFPYAHSKFIITMSGGDVGVTTTPTLAFLVALAMCLAIVVVSGIHLYSSDTINFRNLSVLTKKPQKDRPQFTSGGAGREARG